MSTFEWASVPSTLFHMAIHSTTRPDAPSTSSGASITTYLRKVFADVDAVALQQLHASWVVVQRVEPPQPLDAVEPSVGPVVGETPQKQAERNLRGHRPRVWPRPTRSGFVVDRDDETDHADCQRHCKGRPSPPIRIPCPMSLNDCRSRNNDQPVTPASGARRRGSR